MQLCDWFGIVIHFDSMCSELHMFVRCLLMRAIIKYLHICINTAEIDKRTSTNVQPVAAAWCVCVLFVRYGCVRGSNCAICTSLGMLKTHTFALHLALHSPRLLVLSAQDMCARLVKVYGRPTTTRPVFSQGAWWRLDDRRHPSPPIFQCIVCLCSDVCVFAWNN